MVDAMDYLRFLFLPLGRPEDFDAGDPMGEAMSPFVEATGESEPETMVGL